MRAGTILQWVWNRFTRRAGEWIVWPWVPLLARLAVPEGASHFWTSQQWHPRAWRRASVFLSIAIAASALFASTALACPFCTPLGAPLAERREGAAVAGLAELVSIADSPQDAGGKIARLKLRHLAKGAAPFAIDSVLELSATQLAIARDAKPGSLWLLLGTDPSDAQADAPRAGDLSAATASLEWSAEAANETVYGYFVRAPGLRTPAAERLRYFARYLEHAEPLVAGDVYNEFGLAPLGVVADVADDLPMAKMRGWLVDPGVPGGRKGFYGVALGLARDIEQRTANRALLEALVDQAVAGDAGAAPLPGSDFRAGFDGVLGGLLLIAKIDGLGRIESQLLANPKAAEGDVRHAVAALRFAHEFVPSIPRDRLAAALVRVLPRPGFAATAIVDLARWQAWECMDDVFRCYRPLRDTRGDAGAAAVRRAVVGYLQNAPPRIGMPGLSALKSNDPQGFSAAHQELGAGAGGTLPGAGLSPAAD